MAQQITRKAEDTQQAYGRVVGFLREKLLDGSLLPGDLLVPERELADHLGVSRPVVREALRALAIVGVVEVRERVGTFVRRPDVSVLSDIFTFTLAQDKGMIDDLMQARVAIECQAIRLACERMTPQDLEAVGVTLTRIRDTIGSPVDGGMADFEFHTAIVRASRSETLISLYDAMHPLLMKLHRERREIVSDEPVLKDQIIEDHLRIFQALADKDAEAADHQLRQHFRIGDERRYRAALRMTLG